MRLTIIIPFILPLICMTGCTTIKEYATEPNARDAAAWVRNRAGFIQAAVASVTHIAVYSTEKDTIDRRNVLEALNLVSTKINQLADGHKFNEGEIADSLQIKEKSLQLLVVSVLNIASSELENFKKNGYAEFGTEVLKAITAGIRDGSAQ